ncbi:MAG: hypothetical protein HOQ20_10865 [Bradyrhizobium sp.]|nr:hypothetical protein [Bradyrhizobium sp.]
MTNALVISSTEVAELLRYRCRESFSRKRRALEAIGFPKKLPGLNGWSRPAIERWLENNGQVASNDDTPPAARKPTRLERMFG